MPVFPNATLKELFLLDSAIKNRAISYLTERIKNIQTKNLLLIRGILAKLVQLMTCALRFTFCTS